MKNDEYWARRFGIMEKALADRSYSYVRNLERQYDAAIAQLETEIRAWYQRFADNNGISYSAAQKWLTGSELKEFHWTVQEYIRYGREHAITGAWEKELKNASARVHISRLEALKIQLRQHAEALTAERLKITEKAAELAYMESYHHTAFEVQKGIGVGWTMQAVDTGRLEKILSRPWTTDHQTFRARCWTDKTRLVETVSNELTRMLALGEAPDKAIAAIAKQFGVSKRNAGRVVMTESAYFASAARKDCFENLGVRQYRVVETLDRSTCAVCGSMDGKVFDMSQYQVGATAPPFHPWCRGCTAPYFADMEGMGTRIASDAVTGDSFNVPANMSYEEWKAKQDALHGDGSVDRLRRMRYNENADKAQYGRYKKLFGNEIPKTFPEFQNLKYNDTDTWERLKRERAQRIIYKSSSPTNTTVRNNSFLSIPNLIKSQQSPAETPKTPSVA